jgi:hypothetical protein
MTDPAEHVRGELRKAYRQIAALRDENESLQRALSAAGIALEPHLGKSSERSGATSSDLSAGLERGALGAQSAKTAR